MSNQNSSSPINKAKFWVGILYPENMVDDWQNLLPDIVQIPFAYCVHDKDLEKNGDPRKLHMHLMLAFTNTTTRKHVLSVFNLLSAPGKTCCSMCQACIDVRRSYDYLIHDTETCRKQGKYQYSAKLRISGNNFDIGVYEQLSALEKAEICKDICLVIQQNDFINLNQVLDFVIKQADSNYFQIFMSYSALFERLCKANFLLSNSPATHQQPIKNDNLYCKECGSVHVKKNGKSRAGSQKYQCLDCGKTWSL